MVLALLASIKSLFKSPSSNIDNGVFRMHYRLTTGILAAATLLVTASQYFGDPIACDTKIYTIDKDVVEAFCWTTYTHSVLEEFDVQKSNKDAYPGIGNSDKKTKVYHSYYQWVPFVLFIQALLFYLPRYVWKSWEGGKLKCLTEGMESIALRSEDMDSKKKIILNYLYLHMSQHRIYVIKYCFCEILNFVNVISQIYLLDAFLDGEFREFGIKVINYAILGDYQNRTDPLTKRFPKLTKCNYVHYGPGGDTSDRNFLCVLPLNVINEKIFVFSWFWFVFLAVVTGLMLVYRLAIISSRGLRSFMLRSHCPFVDSNTISQLSRSLNVGDWFIMYQMNKNMQPFYFTEIAEDYNTMLQTNGYVVPTPSKNKATPISDKMRELKDMANKGIGYARNNLIGLETDDVTHV